MWPRDAYVGQRVVCVNDDWGSYANSAIKLGCKLPERPIVYTIREVVSHSRTAASISFRFVEIMNPHVAERGTCEPSFCASQFKPVDETRIDVFREMLKNVPNRKDVVRPETV